MEIKQYKVDKGIAVPLNPYSEYISIKSALIGSFIVDNSFSVFESEKHLHNYATSAPDGVYDADRFEHPVWQYFDGAIWHDTTMKGSLIERQFLHFIDPFEVKSPENKQEFRHSEFTRGFICAVVVLIRSHGCTTEAKDMLGSYRTATELRAKGCDEYDIELLLAENLITT